MVIKVGKTNAAQEAPHSQFPSHLVPKEEKGYEWCLQFVQAAWLEYRSMENGSLYLAADRYATIKAYMQGRQDVERYKAQLEIGDEHNDAWVSLDWTPVKWLMALRNMAVAKISKRDYAINCHPIDTLSKAEREEALARIEARLMIRKELERSTPGGADGTPFEKGPNEPEDDLEMELLRRFTWKHNMAMQAEQTIDVILNSNKYNELRKQLKEDLFEYGACGVKDYIDSAGNVKVRRLRPDRCMVSPCESPTYADSLYRGEIRRMLVSELIEEAGDQFTEEEYVDIARNFQNRFGNPVPVSDEDIYQNYKDYKIEVLDIEWDSIDDFTWEKRTNKFGNEVVGMISPDKVRKETEDRSYVRKRLQVKYQSSWIIGSNYQYNWGLATNMKRRRTSMQEAKSSFHFRAVNFYNNIIVSPAEALIPFADQLQLLWMKYQFMIGKIRADGYAVEMGALEDIALGAGGKNLEPIEVLDMFNQTTVLYYRRMDMAGNPANYEPIRELRTDNSAKLQGIWAQLMQVMQLAKERIGFNQMTDGSSYDPRALKSAVAAADESTNNALWDMLSMERHLFEDVAESVLLQAQTVLRKGGNIKGYTTALGEDTPAFFMANPDLYLRDFGIVISDIPTPEEKEELIARSKEFGGADLVSMEDVFLIEGARNLKQAQMILAMRIEQRRKKRQEEELQVMQQNGMIQQQSSMVAEDQKRQTLSHEHQLNLQAINLEWQWRERIARIEAEARIASNEIDANASMLRLGIATESKEEIERSKQDAQTPINKPQNSEDGQG